MEFGNSNLVIWEFSLNDLLPSFVTVYWVLLCSIISGMTISPETDFPSFRVAVKSLLSVYMMSFMVTSAAFAMNVDKSRVRATSRQRVIKPFSWLSEDDVRRDVRCDRWSTA